MIKTNLFDKINFWAWYHSSNSSGKELQLWKTLLGHFTKTQWIELFSGGNSSAVCCSYCHSPPIAHYILIDNLVIMFSRGRSFNLLAAWEHIAQCWQVRGQRELDQHRPELASPILRFPWRPPYRHSPSACLLKHKHMDLHLYFFAVDLYTGGRWYNTIQDNAYIRLMIIVPSRNTMQYIFQAKANRNIWLFTRHQPIYRLTPNCAKLIIGRWYIAVGLKNLLSAFHEGLKYNTRVQLGVKQNTSVHF